jgi:hypothetical protein
MDNPTRVGLGGAALFTLAAIAAPIVSWWVSGPIMAVCGAIAFWGLSPLVAGRLPNGRSFSGLLGDPDAPTIRYDPKFKIREFDGTSYFYVRVENHCAVALKSCQLFVDVEWLDEVNAPTEPRIPISGLFDLRRGDHSPLSAFVYFYEGKTDNAAFIPYYRDEGGKGFRETFPPFHLPGGAYRLHLKAISENAAAGKLTMKLAYARGEWSLSEC